jgi:hypothetical protein
MKKLAFRIVLTITVLLFAAPMFAQEYGCYDCRQSGTDDAAFMWCDHPADNSWGWDKPCEWVEYHGVLACKRAGSRCYYFEVYG